jgi:hypothetical protein
LRVGASAKRENGAFFHLRGAAKHGAKLIRLDLAESRFAESFENLRDGQASRFFDAFIEIDKAPG